ncbi:protein FAR1-RELATED SEQUENCE 5-like [Juglans microcarpa x Juglans regia]|uniref:protein FAR1-RELATED SEQUENCE 5-like n=1 Tax=Juglans microcarpa x Juglans regia TaxID=2249226 RepID=UPI001B7DAD6C|nr:protein FAR1-RELATED SEQUENCE 5-like [Juglans microcarpa x Juglans regia]
MSQKDTNRIVPEPAETKIGCKTIMGIKKDGEKWIVNKFVVGHNHILLTPRSTSFLRGHRGVTKVQKKFIMTLNESGVPTRKIMSVLSKDSGGEFNVGCIGKDVENYLGTKRRKIFEEEDAQRLYSYFLDRQLKEPGFVFFMQVDKDGCMRSCFWVDARSRATYQYFGDVVTFDATYLTNIYKMSFVPFSRVNHHHQTIMFGCALLINETAESYTWLLRTWKEAMLGRALSTIIIDDDKAMAKAIVERSENMNTFFKDYVRSSTMVSDFVHQYEKAIDARYFKEKEKDVRTKSTQAIMKTPFKIEEEAAIVYTRKSFIIFQDELLNSLRYQAKKLYVSGEVKTYGVTAHGKETSLYHVTLSGDKDMLHSVEKHNHFTLALEKVHKELLAMEDHVQCSQTVPTNDDQIFKSQVISNFSQTVHDPPQVPTKGKVFENEKEKREAKGFESDEEKLRVLKKAFRAILLIVMKHGY